VDLSGKPELAPLARVAADLRAAAPEAVPLLAGATARDILLKHAHGIEPGRATEDIDLAFSVPDWSRFESLRVALIDSGHFRPGGVAHKFRHRDGLLVDIIPFGGVQDARGAIAWPPGGDVVMAVAGYREAQATSVSVTLPGGIPIAVVSLPMLAALKVLAWSERRRVAPRKDAHDLFLILRHYLDAGHRERLYAEAAHLLDAPDFDYERAGAWLAGRDVTATLEAQEAKSLREHIATLLRAEIDPDGNLLLIGETRDPEASRLLLAAFLDGMGSA
jgi:predicted nucleotidyltransferase